MAATEESGAGLDWLHLFGRSREDKACFPELDAGLHEFGRVQKSGPSSLKFVQERIANSFMVPSSLSDVVSLGFAYIPASFPAAPLRCRNCARRTCVGAAARPKAVFGAFWTSAAAGGDR